MNCTTTAAESRRFILKLLGVAELAIIYWLRHVTLFWDIGVNPTKWIRASDSIVSSSPLARSSFMTASSSSSDNI
jgi:hypothetical protein